MTLSPSGRLINAVSDWLDSSPANAERAPEALLWGRIAKVCEEAGEVIEALIGALGHNPRKGVHNTLEHVEYELLDVAAGALLAVSHLYARRGETVDPMTLLGQHVQTLAHTVGLLDSS